ncbi:MAG: hypothetical protein R3301_10055 [Saprospiraceae bacterium]|nr:hypothetical protein [Saprospiraceae bacterium]
MSNRINREFVVRVVFAISLATLSVCGRSQAHLDTLLDFGWPDALFYNVINNNDTLVMNGACLDTNLGQWGLFIAEMDTTGNLISKIEYFDTSGQHILGLVSLPLVPSGQGRYISTGRISSQVFMILAVDSWGDSILYTEMYPDPNVRAISPNHLIRLDEDYWIGGWKQHLDFKNDLFIIRTDSSGTIKSEWRYGEPEFNETLTSFIPVDDTLCVMGIVKRTDHSSITPLEQWGFWSQITAIDSAGDIQWSWQNDSVNQETLVTGLHNTPAGWVYLTTRFEIVQPGVWGGHVKVVHRDTNFNLLWETDISPTNFRENLPVQLLPSPDGTWIAGGNYINAYDGDHLYISGGVHKLSADGEILWEVHRPPMNDSINHTFSYFHGMTMLSSGSVIAAGYTEVNAPVSKSFAWLIKISADGCVDTLCVTTPTQIPRSDLVSISVSPNPFVDIVTFDLAELDLADLILVIQDMSGRIIATRSIEYGSTQVSVDLSNRAASTYVYQLWSEGIPVARGKLVKLE